MRLFTPNGNFAASPNERAQMHQRVVAACDNLLESLGIELDHNTADTASRMARMYCEELFVGRYKACPKVTTFPNHKKLDELAVTGPITVRSTCAHHFLPFYGQAWIGFVPGERLAGLSKFNRVVDWLARRPQIQEELVVQIADQFESLLAPKGLAVVLRCTHQCMTCRGVNETMQASFTTNVMRGSFRNKPEARAEFLAMLTEYR